jgi:hypothetical protein
MALTMKQLKAQLDALDARVAALERPNAPTGRPPSGYDSDIHVATKMFLESMQRHNLGAVAVQGHGQRMVDALLIDYPTLDVYANPRTDALMWPGFGSLDVTIDSGRGGFYFRPDGHDPWLPRGQR